MDWIAGLDHWTGLLELIAGLDFPRKVVRLAKTACVVETSAWQVHMDVAEPWKCGGMQVHHNLKQGHKLRCRVDEANTPRKYCVSMHE